jgi:ATP-dependent Lon protease|tara:strand:- start:1721 stop:4999 length:3279 start_codon:yes stop_codon:yes gene_type:complete
MKHNEKINLNKSNGILLNVPDKDIVKFIRTKVNSFQEIIKKTILAVNKYKCLDILGTNDINICVKSLETLFSQLSIIEQYVENDKNIDKLDTISKLQEINNDLSVLLKSFGTENMDDLITICFGTDFIDTILDNDNKHKYDLIRKYVHPIGYKVMVWKGDKVKKPTILAKNRIVEDFMIVETADNFECFDLARTSKSFQTKVYGIKLAIRHSELKKTLIICGIVDEIMLECLNYPFITNKINSIKSNKPSDPIFHDESFIRYIDVLTVKELLVYSNEELYNRYNGILNQLALIKEKSISQVVKEFITAELFGQRTIIIQLLLKSIVPEFQYLSYLLYDLLSNDNNGNIDTVEQTLLFDSLPWNIKKYFRDAMKQTVKYTNDLCEFDSNKIPLEQQICLMKANENVKERAMVKLKEVKSKSEDTGTKARHYLDGLLKIPFGIFRKEFVLELQKNSIHLYGDLINHICKNYKYIPINKKDSYTNLDISIDLPLIEQDFLPKLYDKFFISLQDAVIENRRSDLIINICKINNIIKNDTLDYHKLCHSGKKANEMKNNIIAFLSKYKNDPNILLKLINNNKISNIYNDYCKVSDSINTIILNNSNIRKYMDDIKDTLDKSVHGHSKAKRQVERIIGQWINGKNEGYSFGFEGPPGVGKTSLAKNGIANILKDIEGNPRPFAFIAVGGDSNSSTISGHNYTYVGSNWGRICDILMEKKCMNPIFFIDELDKVSKTESGKEIIGILTHLIDPTQNNCFQDKFFTGIDLDLSKALFIFSYNDVSLIDKVLLDRIHRVQFEHLNMQDKIIITKNHILPEITEKMGLIDMINLEDDVIEYLIDEYTYEPGVRKLKEILFEIIGEVNLEILKNENSYEIPINISCQDIKLKYLKDKDPVRIIKIHDAPSIATINGLWANALGKGGIIPIEASLILSSNMMDFKLTGSQGDVMKESMNVAKTMAWQMLETTRQKELVKQFDETKIQGIHIHCPEGAVPKDGPSAGTAITCVLYSLLINKKIDNTVAITGEMDIRGNVTGIGGLDLKILGGINAGVKKFIFPEENIKDYDKLREKYKNADSVFNDILFYPVKKIEQVIELIFID